MHEWELEQQLLINRCSEILLHGPRECHLLRPQHQVARWLQAHPAVKNVAEFHLVHDEIDVHIELETGVAHERGQELISEAIALWQYQFLENVRMHLVNTPPISMAIPHELGKLVDYRFRS